MNISESQPITIPNIPPSKEQQSHKTEENKEELEVSVDSEIKLDEEEEEEEPVKVERNMEEDVIRINEEKWPNVNGVYDAQGEWHDWSELTYSYSYENSELIILPYTVCLINLPGQQYVTQSSSN